MKPGRNLPPKFLAAMVAVLPVADGFIVGSTFRQGGKFLEQLEPEWLQTFMNVFVAERERILNQKEDPTGRSRGNIWGLSKRHKTMGQVLLAPYERA